MTKYEKQQFITKYWGEKMEFSCNPEFKHPHRLRLEGISYKDCKFPFTATCEDDDEVTTFAYCRPIPHKKERFLRPEELRGKWIVTEINKVFYIITGTSGNKIQFNGCWREVEELYKNGYTLGDGSLLKVEVENEQ